jgi:hypothetical protein
MLDLIAAFGADERDPPLAHRGTGRQMGGGGDDPRRPRPSPPAPTHRITAPRLRANVGHPPTRALPLSGSRPHRGDGGDARRAHGRARWVQCARARWGSERNRRCRLLPGRTFEQLRQRCGPRCRWRRAQRQVTVCGRMPYRCAKAPLPELLPDRQDATSHDCPIPPRRRHHRSQFRHRRRGLPTAMPARDLTSSWLRGQRRSCNSWPPTSASSTELLLTYTSPI